LKSSVTLAQLPSRPGTGADISPRSAHPGVVGLLALGALAALVLPLSTHQLSNPGWFAVQRVALILGPAIVAWYWERRRPGNRFVPLLLLLGMLAVPLSLEATTSPWAHAIGVIAEGPLLYMTFVVVLAFPTGRLSSTKRGILLVLLVSLVAWYVPYFLLAPVTSGSPLAACRLACPANALQVASHPAFLRAFSQVYSAVGVAVSIAVALVFVSELIRADPPRRRALLIGSVVAVVFLVSFAMYVAVNLSTPLANSAVVTPTRWVLPVARALLPLGYLVALIDAELYAGRLVSGIVDRALRSSRLTDVIETLPAAIGDPELAFGFWVPGREWVRTDGEPLVTPPRDSGQVMTTIDRKGRPLAAIVHRAQLEESPELIHAIVATSLLVVENATLEAELRAAIRDLRESRARVIRAGDAERRRIQRDLHDGAQQRLIALRIKLAASGEQMTGDAGGREHIVELCADVDRALAEIRDLARGIFPPVLADLGLAEALHAAVLDSPLRVRVESSLPRQRYPPDVEAAVYFCAVEALQNATKHAGSDVRVTVTLEESHGDLSVSVRDDGRGFDPSRRGSGSGLTGMQDRLGAVGGLITIESARGSGTAIYATVPLEGPGTTPSMAEAEGSSSAAQPAGD
jgi:signal transduction histidine kinase